MRYVIDNNVSYFLVGAWNQKLSNNVIVAILRFETDATLLNVSVSYHILSSSDVHYIANNIGYINEADEIDLIEYLQRANFPFYNIQNRTNNNPPAPRVIHNGASTYFVYPCKQNNEWYVGYIVEDEVDMGGSNQLYRIIPVGNSQLKWNISDGAIITDLSNNSKWTRKIM